MSAKEMKQLREWAGLTQAQMAERMGLAKSAYVDLEADDPDWKKFKPRHQLALERVSLRMAIEFGNISYALPSVRADALDYSVMVRGAPPKLLLEIQEWHDHGSAFLTIQGAEALPKVGDRLTVTVDHHAARRRKGEVVSGVVERIFDRGSDATIMLEKVEPPFVLDG